MNIVIVGGGPAGMMLAYQLASNGVSVRVVERHPDFAREFRGEYLQSSVFATLEQLGILPELVKRKLAIPGMERRMFIGLGRRVSLPGSKDPGAFVLQEGFLSLLHEASSKFPSYRMDFKTTALEVQGGAVKVRREGAEETLAADLVVVCNGRNSPLRKGEVGAFTVAADTLWLRFDFSDAAAALPDTLDVHMMGKGVVSVFHRTTRDRLQVAFSAPGDLNALKRDVPALKAALLPAAPEALRGHLERKLDGELETQVLRVTVDRLATWHAPGLLFLGDAAHTMSPSGGQGLNVAIRDAVVAANHLIRAAKAGKPPDASVLAAIEAERRPEIEMLQAGQQRAHGFVMRPRPVLHVMFTLMGLFLPIIDKKAAQARQALGPVVPEFGVPL